MKYKAALEIAVDAAKRAGSILLDEFHRPGGPRGQGGHAPADTEAERAIREVLIETGWPIRGEELGQTGHLGDDGHLWLVDPNDGTRSFIRGWRGSAVSIALLRNGKPVLGVVFAYSAPDDEGDLFAWAEGCAFTRNGVVVERAPFAERLAREQTVILSQAGDSTIAASAANADLCSPARFRVMPSIAYRLALVAVGEGEVAVSLNGPVGWDYCGGHALLRAVGGDLVDSRGRPITYSREGHSSCGGRCFGGSRAINAELSRRPWERVFRAGGESSGLCMPQPGWAVSDAGVLSRAQGCLLGQVAGDSLGSLVEFQGPERITASYPNGGPRLLADGGVWGTLAGQPTDDAELALSLARALVAHGQFSDELVAEAYAEWYKSGPFDIGGTTSRALSAAAKAVRAPEASVAASARDAARDGSMGSEANGALMRVSPLGIFGWAMDPNELAALARRDAEITHPNQVCRDASAFFLVAIATAVREGLSAREVYDSTLAWAKGEGLHADVLDTITRAAHEPPQDYMRQMGWVRTGLGNAVHQLLHATSLEDGVIDTVRRGGDTDTNGAIAGALLGAVYGRDAVPAQWRAAVLSCRPLKGAMGVRQPRPTEYWPVDAEVLAEHLLVSGEREPELPF